MKSFYKSTLRYLRCASVALLIVTYMLASNICSISSITAYGADVSTAAATSDKTALAWPTPPEITSGNAILIDADSGAILYDKASHEKGFPASTTKIMTGLLTVENCSFDETVTFSSTAANSVKWDEANLGTKTGEQYTVEQALYGLLLSSANEIAYGLAEHVGGNLSTFVDMMNARAKELGATDTHFNNASGLSDPNHYTTAYDLAMIARGCFNNATFMSIDSYSDTYVIPPTNKTTTSRSCVHRHKMLKGRSFYYQYCKGGKTGFTDESGHTLVTYAEKDGMRLICVILNSQDDLRFIETTSLFEYGFNNFNRISISESDVSSLFTSSSYYNSKVYGNSDIAFAMNASYVDLPAGSAVSDIDIQVNHNANTDTTNYDYTADINFVYNNNVVGTATLMMTTNKNISDASNLPYVLTDESSTPNSKQCFDIDIRVVAIILCVAIIVSFVLEGHFLRKRRGRRRR